MTDAELVRLAALVRDALPPNHVFAVLVSEAGEATSTQIVTNATDSTLQVLLVEALTDGQPLRRTEEMH